MLNTVSKDFEADMRDHLDKLEMYKYELELAKKEKDDVDIKMFTIYAFKEANLIRDLVLCPDIALIRRYKIMHA